MSGEKPMGQAIQDDEARIRGKRCFQLAITHKLRRYLRQA